MYGVGACKAPEYCNTKSENNIDLRQKSIWTFLGLLLDWIRYAEACRQCGIFFNGSILSLKCHVRIDLSKLCKRFSWCRLYLLDTQLNSVILVAKYLSVWCRAHFYTNILRNWTMWRTCYLWSILFKKWTYFPTVVCHKVVHCLLLLQECAAYERAHSCRLSKESEQLMLPPCTLVRKCWTSAGVSITPAEVVNGSL